MNITLPPELERLVKEKIESGSHETASDVVREALGLLKERDEKLRALRADLEQAAGQVERGEFTEFDEHTIQDLAEDVKGRSKERLQIERGAGSR